MRLLLRHFEFFDNRLGISVLAVLNPERIAVKLRLQYVQKYKERSAFDVLSEGDKGE